MCSGGLNYADKSFEAAVMSKTGQHIYIFLSLSSKQVELVKSWEESDLSPPLIAINFFSRSLI